jgi:predicted enzyme related to lactoylglutathione lyase
VSLGFTAHLGRLEIPARDPAAAATFYQRAFGWQARASTASGTAGTAPADSPPTDSPPYVTLRPLPRTADGSAADAAAREPAAVGLTTAGVLGSSEPLAVLHVAGAPLATVLARIVAAGGRVDLPPTAVGEAGFFARFRDPEGHLLGLWQTTDANS